MYCIGRLDDAILDLEGTRNGVIEMGSLREPCAWRGAPGVFDRYLDGQSPSQSKQALKCIC